MFNRCYDLKFQEKEPTYKGCYVSDEWHNFQNFGGWYDENYYEVQDEKMTLDKDILIKGNKIYSSEVCIFVPKRINSLFVKIKATRGNLPIGVHFSDIRRKYISQCNIGNGKRVTVGSFDTPEEAFYAYKEFKENYIKQIAEEYKNKIPFKLYSAMLNYEIDITD